MRRKNIIITLTTASLVAGAALATAAVAVGATAAGASAAPVVTGLSVHRGPYWGGTSVTISGQGFTGATAVTFGRSPAWSMQVVSPTVLTATVPWHSYGASFVRVTTPTGRSAKSPAASFTFATPSLQDPILGGLTARTEQHLSAQIRARHKAVPIAHASKRWTPAMGRSAVRRAASWLGIPYSWAGGNGAGPSRGVCAHNGGDLDCHVIGFDCSGLTLNAWWPYEHLDHYTVTQHARAGAFHPSMKELVPGDLVFFAGSPGGTIDHTAIYAGHGMVVQAPMSGRQVTTSALADVIAASGAYRGATRPMTTGPQGWGPLVTAVTPAVTTAGGTITITGKALDAVTTVSVGRTTLYSFVSRSADKVVVAVPAHAAGSVNVTVANAWGVARRTLTYVTPAS